MPDEQVRSQRRNAQILDAALHVFTQKGYHAASVDDIAAESETSKGGIYFHFPGKQAIFLALLERMTALLRSRVETAVASERDPLRRAETALQIVLETFASHRTLTRLFLVEAAGAGREFNERMTAIHTSFATLIQHHLDEAVAMGAIPPLNTIIAGRVWFGAINEIVTSWILTDTAAPLEEVYPTVRSLLLRGISAPERGTADDSH